jgi:excisionase family DNA binding protein
MHQGGHGVIELERHYRAREAAALLGVTERSVRTWIAEGRLPVIRVSRTAVLIPASAIRAMLRKATATSVAVTA